MSAAQPGELREALVHIARAMNPMLHDPLMTTIAEQWVDEHILPVVTAYAEQQARARAAEELRSAADSIRYQLPGFIGRVDTADALDDRAADLAADDRTDPA